MLRVFTAFSGYDSQCLALNRLGIDYDLVGWSEIDRYAIKAHNILFPQYAERNYGDISKVDWTKVPDFDLFTYSSPCQDFSIAGKMKGGQEGSGTRSSLLWECRKAILAKKPKMLVLENVKNLVCGDFYPLFVKWEQELASYGYNNYWKVLNATDFNVPQNRERVFLVSIRDDRYFDFPAPVECTRRLKDILEDEYDEKYIVNPESFKSIIAHCERKVSEGCGFKPSLRGGAGHKFHNNNALRAEANGHIDKYKISDMTIKRIQKNRGCNEIGQDTDGVARTITCAIPKVTTFDNYIKTNGKTESHSD